MKIIHCPITMIILKHDWLSRQKPRKPKKYLSLPFSHHIPCVLNFPMTSSSNDTSAISFLFFFFVQWTTDVVENNRLGDGVRLLSIALFVYHLIYNTVPSASHNQLKDGRAGEAPHQSQKFTSNGRDAFEDLPHPWKSSPRMQGQI